MTSFVHTEGTVMDSEDDECIPNPRITWPLIPRTGILLICHLGHVLGRMTRFCPRSNTMPLIRKSCLIFKGKAGVDEG
jgi:hypothetical protein